MFLHMYGTGQFVGLFVLQTPVEKKNSTEKWYSPEITGSSRSIIYVVKAMVKIVVCVLSGIVFSLVCSEINTGGDQGFALTPPHSGEK